jgi:hypothetical protein
MPVIVPSSSTPIKSSPPSALAKATRVRPIICHDCLHVAQPFCSGLTIESAFELAVVTLPDLDSEANSFFNVEDFTHKLQLVVR